MSLALPKRLRRTSALVGAFAAVLAWALPLHAQFVPVLRSAAKELWLAPESGGPAQLALTDVSLLPLHVSGAVRVNRLRVDAPAPITEGPAPHVRLPQGGRLWRVSRGTATGLLHIDANGAVTLLAETPDVGGLPGIPESVAVARDGTRVLIATTLAAGGHVLLATPSTPHAPPVVLASGLDVAADSLRVSSDRAFFVASGVLHAADLRSTTAATTVNLPAAALPDLALAEDGLSLAVVTEASPGVRHVHVLGASLAPVQITQQAADYDTPNGLDPSGPWLAIAPDGEWIAVRRTVLTKELFLLRVPQPMPAAQVTADPQFEDTIDNVGVLGFVASGVVAFFAGETNLGGAPGALGSSDRYTASLDGAGVLGIVNQTQTSGSTTQPFVQGDLEPLDSVLDPAGERWLLVVDPDGGDAALMAVDLQTPGLQPLLPALAAEPTMLRAGLRVLVASHPVDESGQTELHLLHEAGAPAGLVRLGSVPNGVTVDRLITDDDGTSAAFVASVTPGLELLVRVELPSGLVSLPWPAWVGLGSNLAFSPAGRLVAGIGNAGGPWLHAAFTGPFAGSVLKVPVGAGYPLP